MDFDRSPLILVESKSSHFARSSLTILEEPTSPPSNMQNSARDPADDSDLDTERDSLETNTVSSNAEEGDTIIEVQQMSETSEEFNDTVKRAILGVPDTLRNKLKEKGWSIVTCRLLGEVMQTQQQPPVPWNMLSIAILVEPQQVIIPESTYDQQGSEIPSLNPDGLLRNAIGHVVDSLAPEYVTQHFHDDFSDLESFKYAHVSDVARLGQDKKQKLAIYVDEADVSRAEMFAEGFAALHGGGAIYTIDVMSKYFPAAMKQLKDIMEAVDTGSQITNAAQGDKYPDEADQQDTSGASQQVQGTQGGP